MELIRSPDGTVLRKLASPISGRGAALVSCAPAPIASPVSVLDRLSEQVSVRAYGAIGDGVSRPLSGLYATLAEAQAVYPCALSLDDELDWAAMQTALDTGKYVQISKPPVYYVCNRGLFIRTVGQDIRGDGAGSGNDFSSWDIGNSRWNVATLGTAILFTGAPEKAVITRRQARLTSSDPNDAPMACGIQIEAECVRVSGLDLICDVNLTAAMADHTELGADYDCAVFIGCRLGVEVDDVRCLGYWRVTGPYHAVDRSSAVGRFTDPWGNLYPPQVQSGGSDQVRLNRVVSYGPLKGGWTAGPLVSNPTGEMNLGYYDWVTDTVLPNEGGRGGGGASDFKATDCVFASREHASGRRARDPVSPLNFDNEDLEGLPCSYLWDARRGPDSQGRARHATFINCRAATMEATRFALGNAFEIVYINCTTEPRSASPSGATTVRADGGTIVGGASDQTANNYGPQAAKTTNGNYLGADHITIIAQGTTPAQAHFFNKVTNHAVYAMPGMRDRVGELTVRNALTVSGASVFYDPVEVRGNTVMRSHENGNPPGLVMRDTDTVVADGESLGTITWQSNDADGGTNKDAFQLQVTGDGSTGSGQLNLRGVVGGVLTTNWTFRTAGNLLPRDNACTVGGPSNRVSEFFGANNVINTSDARLKTVRGELTPAELAAWAEIRWLIFRWNESIATKGDAARLHAGTLAQEVEAAFAAQGLDASHYGLWCADPVMQRVPRRVTVQQKRLTTETRYVSRVVIEDGRAVRRQVPEDVQVPVVERLRIYDEAGALAVDEDGQPLWHEVPVMDTVEREVFDEVPTGDVTYSLRYEQCLVMEAAYLRAELAALRDRVTALESA